DARPHEIGHGRLARLDVVALAGSGDKLGAFDLRLALRALKSVPLAPALAGLRITHVDDDGPVTGRPFAKMPPHFDFSSLSVDAGCSAASRRRAILAACSTACSIATAIIFFCSSFWNDTSSRLTISVFMDQSWCLAACSRRRRRRSESLTCSFTVSVNFRATTFLRSDYTGQFSTDCVGAQVTLLTN